MYSRFYSRNDPPPLYLHRCGQELEVRERSVGHQVRFEYWAGGHPVRDCPRCGRRLYFGSLIHPDEFVWIEDYQDERDTVRCLESIL